MLTVLTQITGWKHNKKAVNPTEKEVSLLSIIYLLTLNCSTFLFRKVSSLYAVVLINNNKIVQQLFFFFLFSFFKIKVKVICTSAEQKCIQKQCVGYMHILNTYIYMCTIDLKTKYSNIDNFMRSIILTILEPFWQPPTWNALLTRQIITKSRPKLNLGFTFW